jgi:adenylosuccinate synthase
VTKLDVFTGLRKLSICVGYERGTERVSELPDEDLESYKPVYETLEGWDADLSEARTLGDLPSEARAYVERIERLAGCPVTLVSVGSRRDATIVLSNPFALG